MFFTQNIPPKNCFSVFFHVISQDDNLTIFFLWRERLSPKFLGAPQKWGQVPNGEKIVSRTSSSFGLCGSRGKLTPPAGNLPLMVEMHVGALMEDGGGQFYDPWQNGGVIGIFHI